MSKEPSRQSHKPHKQTAREALSPSCAMIPVSHVDPYVKTYYPHRLPQRRHWIPPTVSSPMVSPQHVKPMCTTEDEICAANVLLNLSPKGQSPHPPPRRFGSQCRYEANGDTTQKVEQSRAYPTPSRAPSSPRNWYGGSSPGHVSDNSCEYNSEASSSEDSSTTVEGEEFLSDTRSSSVQSVVGKPPSGYQGSVSLSLPEDDDVLSPLHCFMRRYCVEAFSASPQDVSTPRYGKSHGVKVVAGQVGIRCLYCKHHRVGKRPERAVCFPSSLRNIYHSIETWQRRHSLLCKDIPPWVRKSILELMESSKSRAGGRRQYWEESASRLGMVDTPQGVRFSRPPGDLGAAPTVLYCQPSDTSSPVVHEGDRGLVTEYLFLLMEQMQSCKFAEEDRIGGRSKIKDNQVGFPGMQCRHCHGKAGFGRYFPSTVNALALANSDRNIYNHIQKCRRCPSHIKSNLQRLSRDQTQSKNRRGLRKQFFQRVWNSIHGPSS